MKIIFPSMKSVPILIFLLDAWKIAYSAAWNLHLIVLRRYKKTPILRNRIQHLDFRHALVARINVDAPSIRVSYPKVLFLSLSHGSHQWQNYFFLPFVRKQGPLLSFYDCAKVLDVIRLRTPIIVSSFSMSDTRCDRGCILLE